MALGGRGVISVASNVVPGHLARLCDAMAAGDYAGARDIHFQLLPLFGLLFAEPNPIPAKTALELMGVMDAEVRLPLSPCSPALRARLGEYLRGKGLL
jgi:4-hydroxy-tetrahydrodipicolinate synthase